MPPFPFSSLLLSPPNTATHNRRSLQQSFFLQNSSPPTDKPSPETSFFPSIASPPPPPSTPSPPAYVSFFSTAQTSKSSTLSTNLLAVGLLVFAAAVSALVIVLCVRRMLWRSFSNCKTNRASYSKGVSQLNGLPKPGRSPVPNLEFLYAGTIANSHGGVSPHVSLSSGGDVSLRKLDSPELHPLTPLGQRNSRNCYANADVGSHREVEEVEFYSAMESLRALESSVENRSAMGRDFAAAAAENVDARSNGASYSASSHSLSNWGSPTRSVSLSTSSPTRSVSLSTSSPELMAVQSALPPPLRPQPRVMTEFANMNTTPSPSPSYSSSPERDSEESLASSPRSSNISLTNAESPMKTYSVFWSALYCSKDSPSRSFSWETPVENRESSAPISYVGFNQFPNKRNSQSPPVFSSFSPPERPLGKNPSHPNMESQARFETMFLKPVPVSVAPQPPLPPPPGGHGERFVSTPSRSQPTLNPPVLITPSRPGTLHRPTLISPTVLPHNSESLGNSEETQKPMLKPLHWDKVRASSVGEMAWDQLKPRLKEEMIQTSFVPDTLSSNWKETVLSSLNQENRVLDPKKAQNIEISLRALNMTTDKVCEALSEGNADALGTLHLESLLKMTPTKEEERRLKEHKDNSPFKLGPAERFLKAVLDIPFAFKRVGAMLYIANFKSEVEYLKRSFDILEAACEELRNSRMFLKLLEAVLKTGNHMNIGTNRGDAHAFKLDTLLKLVDVKGANGKSTLLHFGVLETIRTERFSGGNQNRNNTLDDDARRRKLALQVVSSLSSELKNVMKAAAMDSDMLVCNVMKLSRGIETIAEIVPLNEEMGLRKSIGKFSESMKRFTRTAEEEITRIRVQESVALSLVKEIIEYFQGDSAKEEAHPFRIFMLVRDFVTILEGVCKEVQILNERTVTGIGSAHKFPIPVNPTLQPVNSGFPRGRNYRYFYDESLSPL